MKSPNSPDNPFDNRSNPFENDIVREPREVSFSVPGLNDAALNALVQRFSQLDSLPTPRDARREPIKAQLVVSPNRGYGKSHLLGRLFVELSARATTIYLRPFQDPEKAWQSILSMTAQELTRQTDGMLSPLEMLAVAILSHLGADSLAEPTEHNGREAAEAAAFLRQVGSNPAQAGGLDRAWIDYLTHPTVRSDCVRSLRKRLRLSGANLGGRERAWVSVLAALIRDDRDGENWSAALRWLRGEPLEPEEARRLDIDHADNDGRAEATGQQIDTICFQRLKGLCVLASFHHPFVFCFDQTEFFVGDAALIKTLGKCIEQLVDAVQHHLTVVTANQRNWLDHILPEIEPPHRERLHPELIELEGISKDGSRELILERLSRGGFDEVAITAFFSDDWLEGVFATFPELSVREVLMRAAERFRTLAKLPSPPPITLDALFAAEVAAIKRRKPPFVYDQDALLWFVKDVGQGLEGVKVERTAARRYFSTQWAWPDRRVVFAFEGGDHWNRWKSIAEEAKTLADQNGLASFASRVLRTPDLAKVPRASWTSTKPALLAAQARGFRIVELPAELVCELYAAREFYSNALQGNIAYDGPETLAWLQARFAAFLLELSSPAAVAPAPRARPEAKRTEPKRPEPIRSEPKRPEAVPAAGGGALAPDEQRLVVELVRAQKIVDMAFVLEMLGGERRRADLLRCVDLHPNLRAHPGPAKTLLQWRI